MNEGTPPGASAPVPDSQTKPLGDVIAINEGLIKDHLNKVVVKTVEETLNAMLDAEATSSVGRSATSILRTVSTPGPATTSASSIRRPAR